MPTSDKSQVLSSYSECFCQLSLFFRPSTRRGDASWLGDPAWSDIQDISAIQQMYDNEIHGEVHTNI